MMLANGRWFVFGHCRCCVRKGERKWRKAEIGTLDK